MVCGLGAGMFSDTGSVADLYELPGFASVSQAEEQAILEAWMGHDPSTERSVTILWNAGTC